MKTILLLGGYGFIGTNILKYVEKLSIIQQYQFVVLDRYETHPVGISTPVVVKAYAGDWTDEALMEKIFKTENIDCVIHALSSTVPVTSDSARYDVLSNLLPTISLLDKMLQYGVSDIVFLSSGGAIYGEGLQTHKETDDAFPKSSYGVVKLAIEKYLFLYTWKGIRPLVLRLSNPYGPYHYSMKQGLINVALKTAEQGKEFVVWGDGTATKDYIYVEDVCRILFQLMEQNQYGEVFNVGSGETLSVNQILCAIRKYYPDFKWRYQPQNSTDVNCVKLDISKVRERLSDFEFVCFDLGLKGLYDREYEK